MVDPLTITTVTTATHGTIQIRDGYLTYSPHADFLDDNFTDLMGTDTTLSPGETTDVGTISFYNPDEIPFTHDLVVFGRMNKPPRFTTPPVVAVTAVSGKSNEYLYTINLKDC